MPRPADARAPRSDVAWADANLFVALLAGPEHHAHDRALDLFREVADKRLTLLVTPVVVAEIAVIMWRRFDRDRATIAEEISQLLSADGLTIIERPALERALEIHGSSGGLDFVGAYLAARAELDGPPTVASFDRDFERIEGIRRIAS